MKRTTVQGADRPVHDTHDGAVLHWLGDVTHLDLDAAALDVAEYLMDEVGLTGEQAQQAVSDPYRSGVRWVRLYPYCACGHLDPYSHHWIYAAPGVPGAFLVYVVVRDNDSIPDEHDDEEVAP